MGFLMRSFLVRVLVMLTITVAGVAHAQLRVVITEGQVAPTPIAIADFTGPDGGHRNWPPDVGDHFQ